MEWEIPEPLNIRPSQKPHKLQARQLHAYPFQLKKLPHWVDNATFQIPKTNYRQNLINVQKNAKDMTNLQNSEIFGSLKQKYQKRDSFDLVYWRGEQNYVWNQNISSQYIPTDYVCLEQFDICAKNKGKARMTNKNISLSIISPKPIEMDFEFDSKFQSGNLAKVYQQTKIAQNEYHLVMQNDTNTLGYTQWFAFSIRNVSSQPKLAHIRIVNFIKSQSLYKNGMKPWIIREGKSCWSQIQEDCCYKKTNVKNSQGQFYYELTFSVEITPGMNFISMMPLYTYTRLCSKIQKWLSVKGMRLHEKKIYTLLNNILPILQFIPHLQFNQEISQEQLRWQDTVVIFARTHPGEVWSSFIAEEFIETLIYYHKCHPAKKFRYLIFPMINPDGVIHGNFRCDFSGVDLNRVWINPSKLTQPAIYHVKKSLIKQLGSKKAKFFVDFHSHSKSYNIFAYTSAQTMLQARLIPDLIRLSSENKIFDPISYSNELNRQFLMQSQTTFLSKKQIFYTKKRSTARAFLSQLSQKGNAMTIQVSFHGYQKKVSTTCQVQPFSLKDFNDFCWMLLKKLHDYIDQKEQLNIARKMLQAIYNMSHSQIQISTLNQSPANKDAKNSQQFDKIESDSDSQPQKYYTNETKKKIKAKNNQISDKNILSIEIRQKGYLKQTQSMIQKLEHNQKDRNLEHAIKYQKNRKVSQLKVVKNPKQRQISSKLRDKSFLDQFFIKQNTSQESLEKLIAQNPLDVKKELKRADTSLNQIPGEKDYSNSIRKKIQIQIRRKQFKFIKERKHQTFLQRSNIQQQLESSKQIKNTDKRQMWSILQKPYNLFQTDQSKVHVPTFGKFLTTSKRNVSRRYKTVLKEQLAAFDDQLNKLNRNSHVQKISKPAKSQNSLVNFLEQQISVESISFKPQKDTKKGQIYNQQNYKNLKTQAIQQNGSVKNAYKDSLTIVNSPELRKMPRKISCISKISNGQNKYLSERKKIVEMMKKQTRVYANINEVKMNPSMEEIQQIISKRKRARTQFSMDRNLFEDKKIFMDNKMFKVPKK